MTGPQPTPRTVIAAPLYNQVAHLPAALESLLGQTDPDLALLLVEDGADPATAEVAARCARSDERVTLVHNEHRLGLVANWRRCFESARSLYPDAPYFAWASDHDLWHPQWLESMTAQLADHPEAVIAYPACQRIDADGTVVKHRGGSGTVGVRSRAARMRIACTSIHAGDAVYGLMRADALERAGVFRAVMEPDRLLIAELATQGEFCHVPATLWQRRFVKTASRARQRQAIFPSRPPLHSWLAPWIVRPAVYFWVYAVRGESIHGISRREGILLAGSYTSSTLMQFARHRREHLRKAVSRSRKRTARRRKRIVRAARRAAHRAKRALIQTKRPKSQRRR